MSAHRSHPLALVFALTALLFATVYGAFAGSVEAAPTLQSNTCLVEATGDNNTDYSSADASALQTAVNNATAGDTLKVAGTCAGVQTQNSRTQTVYINKNITIRGGYTAGNWNTIPNPAVNETVLDAGSNGRVVYITNNANVTLSNLTLRNGESNNGGGDDWGGGIYADPGTSVTFENGRIENSQAGFGGAIMTYEAPLLLDNSTLSGNTASSAGGGIYAINLPVTITHSSLVSNTANGGGGGISSDGAPVLIEHSTFSDNQLTSASGDGGALSA
ncbi:MAG: hypothetical protein KDD89_05320, partial [Anaerolineales bacterium]|nr:hypothetical protein [Anaerolineales bacterium]